MRTFQTGTTGYAAELNLLYFMNMHCHGFWHNVYVTYNYKATHR